MIESNEFGTDEFIQWCRDVGCVPFICNNAGNGTISEMVDWLEYCNETSGEYAELRKKNGHPKPLNVPIWSIGNENWGGHEIGAKTIGEWEPLVLEAAKKMKAVDPEIKLSVAATRNESWTLPLLKTAGDYLDYVSVHGIMHSQDPENHISDVIRILDKAGHRGNIKIAFDEWNLRGWHHPGFPRKKVSDYDNQEIKNLVQARDINLIDSQYTMADALFTASFFNASLRHAEDVGMANIAPIVNTRGPLHVYPKGIVKRTTFHVMAMYANLLGSRVGAANIKSGMLVHGDKRIPVVDAISTVDESGMLWSIALINRHPTEVVDCTVKFKDELLDGSFGATLLSGDSPEAFNDIEHSNRVVPENKSMIFQNGVVKLPPHSLSIIKLSIK